MECYTPIQIKDTKHGGLVTVPCGKCETCKKRRVSQWSFRLMQQDKHADSAYFITLTYDTTNVPITRRGYMVLRKRDLQLFFKRLRKREGSVQDVLHDKRDKKPIKYYAVGEYGGQFKRPHYHVILFNLSSPELVLDTWNKGEVHFGFVSGASVGYTLKYMSKQSQIPMHKNDDRIREFALMSKDLVRST